MKTQIYSLTHTRYKSNMLHFISQEKDKMLLYDPSTGIIREFDLVGTQSSDESYTPKVFKNEENKSHVGRGMPPDIKQKIEASLVKGVSVKTIESLYGYSSMAIYKIKRRLSGKMDRDPLKPKKSSADFSGPIAADLEKKDGMKEMIEKYGKTAVNSIIDMHLVGNSMEVMCRQTGLKEAEVEEVIEKTI